jgi:hypothetical protein
MDPRLLCGHDPDVPALKVEKSILFPLHFPQYFLINNLTYLCVGCIYAFSIAFHQLIGFHFTIIMMFSVS